MIEIKIKDIPGKSAYTCWVQWGDWMIARNRVEFSLFDYRIAGVVYTKADAKFNRAFDKELIWKKLND